MVTRCKKCQKLFSTKIEVFKVYCEECEKILMNKGLAEKVLFEGEADEYAAIINNYPISHDDCIEILKVVAELKSKGLSNDLIISKLRRNSY